VSESDVIRFEKLTGKNNVVYVPHGVNTNFFCYDLSIKKNNSILMVGNWLRDFEIASNVFKKMNDIAPHIEINVLSSRLNRKYFDNLKINFIESISSENLLDYYQRASVVYFPFIKFTANNALLEAASCGCNIIISCSHKPTLLYFDDTLLQFIDNDINKVVESILNTMNSSDLTSCITLSSYTKSKYDWKTVSDMTYEILNKF
jgi:glycosyltransferase involved in cell wall biosynthesis